MRARWIVPVALFLAGIGCVLLYFRMSYDDSGLLEDNGASMNAGILLADTVPLGKIAVLEDGTLLAGNNRGEVKIFAPEKDPLTVPVSKTSISAPVTEYNGIYYVGDEGGTFSAFTPEQGVLWSFRAGNQITGAAIPSGGLIWFGAHDNSMYALGVDGDTRGKKIHEVECRGQINGTPLILDGFVYFGSCDGNLRKIDMLSGEVVRSFDFESYIPESPVLFNHVLYLLTNGGDLAAVNPENLDIIYRVHTDFAYFSSPFVTDEYIYLTDSEGGIHVRNRKDGTPAHDIQSETSWNPVTLAGENGVYVISKHGRLSHFETGVWEETVIAEIPSDFSMGVVMARDMFIVADDYGFLFYVEQKDMTP